MTAAQPKNSTTFVFAGGGSLGAVQVGMLKALVRNAVMPDFVVGASVGAMGVSRVIVLPTGFSCSIDQPPGTVVATALHALNLMVVKQFVRDTEFHSGEAR